MLRRRRITSIRASRFKLMPSTIARAGKRGVGTHQSLQRHPVELAGLGEGKGVDQVKLRPVALVVERKVGDIQMGLLNQNDRLAPGGIRNRGDRERVFAYM